MGLSHARLGDTPLHPRPHTAYHLVFKEEVNYLLTGTREDRPEGTPGDDLPTRGADSNVR